MTNTQSKQESKRALLYSIGYVGLSTIFLYSMYPSDPFAFDGIYDSIIYWIFYLLSFPGNLLSWGVRFGGVESIETELFFVFISQVVNVLIWWKIILYIMRK